MEYFVPSEFEQSLKFGLVFMVACCFGMEDFFILVILIWGCVSIEFVLMFDGRVCTFNIGFWITFNKKLFSKTHVRFCKVLSSMAFHFHCIFFSIDSLRFCIWRYCLNSIYFGFNLYIYIYIYNFYVYLNWFDIL